MERDHLWIASPQGKPRIEDGIILEKAIVLCMPGKSRLLIMFFRPTVSLLFLSA